MAEHHVITNLAEAVAAIATGGPGVYDMPSEVYHQDPCPTPSLSAGGVHTLATECPKMLWQEHPRLNTAVETVNKLDFDIGRAAHLIYLEPHLFTGAVVEIHADDYRTGAARAARDEARAAGKIPLLPQHLALVNEMREAFAEYPLAANAFVGGKAEQSAFWQDTKTGAWCRMRPDYVVDGGRHIVDFKTAASANPDDFSRAAFDLGYYSRAAFYLDGWQAATGVMPTEYWFVVQCKKPPYLVSVIKLDFYSLDAGREDCRRQIDTFARCLAAGTERRFWPGYRLANSPDRDAPFVVSLPGWAHVKIHDRLEPPRATEPAVRRVVERGFAPGE